jgi:hypothetical protein
MVVDVCNGMPIRQQLLIDWPAREHVKVIETAFNACLAAVNLQDGLAQRLDNSGPFDEFALQYAGYKHAFDDLLPALNDEENSILKTLGGLR